MWACFKMLCPMTCDLTVPVPSAANMLQCCCHTNTKTCPFARQTVVSFIYEGHLESKERFAIKKYLLIIGKKKNMQVLSHTFTYFST